MKSIVALIGTTLAFALVMNACGEETKVVTQEVEVVPPCGPEEPHGVCAAGQTCFEGACVDDTELCSLTNEEGQCPTGSTCFAGGCIAPNVLCAADVLEGICEVGSTCLEGMCVATSDLCSTSNTDGLCAGDLVCIDGICGVDDGTEETDPCEEIVYTAQPSIGVRAGTGKEVITVDGLDFKDSNGNGELDVYEDWRLLEICRAKDLVSKMSIEEKLGTMRESSLVGSGTEDGTIPDNVKANLVDSHYRYALIRVGSRSASELATYLNNVQELVEAENLGIPVTITADPLHGFGMSTSTQTGALSNNASSVVSAWPYPLGLGAINDAAVTRAFGDQVRREFMAMGFRWQLGPMGDSATEPRWARVQNTFGASPHAVALHTKMTIAGFQGLGDGGLKNGIAATMKHFPGAGPNEDGMDSHSYPGRFNVFPGGWFELHQIPFQAAIDVGAAAVMPCYSVFKDQFDYVPTQVAAGFSYELITEYLKEGMGFDGMVTGDWGTIADGYNTESTSLAQRAAMWVQAGSHQFGSDRESSIADALEQGLLTEAEVDGAVAKILEMTFKLGMFEDPYVADETAAEVRSADNRAEGFEAQQKAIVIVKNRAHGFEPAATGWGAPPDPAPNYLPIDGTRTNDDGEYICDPTGDGEIKVLFDGEHDSLVADADNADQVTDIYGEYDYTTNAGTDKLAISDATGYADADFAVLRIVARKGQYFGLDAGVPLSFDGPFPGQDSESGINASIVDRNRVIDALRARDGYTDADGNVVAAVNPDLKIILVMHMDRPGIVHPFIQGLTTLDETPGEPGSYPLVSDEANIDPTGLSGVDALLVDFGAFDRAVLDVIFNVNAPDGWTHGSAVLPMELPSSDAEVAAQYEDVPNDTANPTFNLGTSNPY